MAKKQQKPAVAPNVKSHSVGQNQNDSGDMSRWYWLVPVVAAFLIFATGLRNAVTGIDDNTATLDNPMVNDFAFSKLIGQYNLGMYAPLTWMGYALAYAVGGKSPVPFHLLSLAVHCFNVYLVYRFMQRMQLSSGMALAISLIFAIHPIQVESVSWIAGFSTPLFSMFYLLALLRYVDYTDNPQTGLKDYGLALILFVLASLAKSAAVTLPIALLVIDLWRKPANLDRNRQWMGYIPFGLIALGFGILTIISRRESGMNVADENHYGVFERLQLLCYTPFFYWIKMLIPSNFNIYYAFEKAGSGFSWPYWASLAGIPAVLAAALAWRKQAPWFTWGLAFFFATLLVMLPFASMGVFELIADHYNYLSVIGIAFILVFAWQKAQEKWPAAAGAIRTAGFLWIAVLAIMSVRQVQIWKNTMTLISNAIDNGYHQNGKMYSARGIEYGDQGNMQAAIADFSKALEYDPNLKDALKFRGGLYAQLQQLEPAQKDLEKYAALDPQDVTVHHNLGMIYLRNGQFEKSLASFNKAIAIKPEAAVLYARRAQVYEAMGDVEKANADKAKADQIRASRKSGNDGL
ncbi:MAG: tetratricopeptide repeat protein [Saprospiraceae bacterium]|nr:tetratricopeptide repeat protein [Saprospiraceae bacterium]